MKSERPRIATPEWCEENLNTSNPSDRGKWDWALMADIAVVTTASPYTIQNIVEELVTKLSADDVISTGGSQ
jgi:hypothetical protein